MVPVFPPYTPMLRDAVPVKCAASDGHTLPHCPRTWVEAEAFIYESGCTWARYIDWLPKYDAPLQETGMTIEVSCRDLSDYDEKQQGYLLVLHGNTQEPCRFGRQLVLYQEFPVELLREEIWSEACQRIYTQLVRPAAFDYLIEAQEFLARFLRLETDEEFRLFQAIASLEEHILLGRRHKRPAALKAFSPHGRGLREEDKGSEEYPDGARTVSVVERLLSTGLIVKSSGEFHTPEFVEGRLDAHYPFVVLSRCMPLASMEVA